MAKKTVSFTAAALPILQTFTKQKTTIPVLSQVLVIERNGQKIAQATDLDLSVEVRVNDDVAPGLYSIIGKELVPSNMKKDNFPVLRFETFDPNKGGVMVPTETISRLLPFISKEQSRYTLNGALIAKLNDGRVQVCATDGHRMVVQDVNDILCALNEGRYVVPVDALKQVAKNAKKANAVLFEVNEVITKSTDKNGKDTDVSTKTFRFTFSDPATASYVTYITRALTGQFPNYEAVMPREIKHQVSVTTEEYLAALQAIKPFANERSGSIRFTDKGGYFELYAKSGEGYEKTVKVPYRIHRGVNFINGKSLLAQQGAFLAIQMPMRVENHTYEPVLDDDGKPVIGEGGKPLTKRVENEAEFALNIEYLMDTAKVTKSDRLYIGWTDASRVFAFTPVEVPESWAERVQQAEEAVAA